MNLLSIFPGLSWIKITAVTLALVALAGLAWKWRHDAVVEAVAAERAVWVADLNRRVAAQLLQEQANREKEQSLGKIIEGLRNDITTNQKLRAAAVAANADSLRKLREALASKPGQAGTDPATSSGTDDPRATIIYQCASTVAEMDGDIGRLKDKVTGLQSYVSDVCLK